MKNSPHKNGSENDVLPPTLRQSMGEPSCPIPTCAERSCSLSKHISLVGLLSASSVTKIGLAANFAQDKNSTWVPSILMMVYFSSWKQKHHSCKFHHLSVCSIHWRAGQVTVVLCHFQGPHVSFQSFKTCQTWPNKKRWHVDMPVGHANWDAFDAILAAYHLP